MATGGQEASADETALEFLVFQALADLDEAVNRMRMLLRRSDKRLQELIWHLDIEPLERESAEYRAHLLSRLGQRRRSEPSKQRGEGGWIPPR